MVQRSGRREPKRITVKSPVFDELKFLGGGEFELGVTTLVLYGRQPADDTEFQYIVGNRAVSTRELVDSDGKASAKLRLSIQLHGRNPLVAIYVASQQSDVVPVLVPLKKVELPEPKRQIRVLNSFVQGDSFDIYLRRIGKDGKPEAGRISYFDFDIEDGGPVERTIFTEEMEAGKDAVGIRVPIFEQARTIEFFFAG